MKLFILVCILASISFHPASAQQTTLPELREICLYKSQGSSKDSINEVREAVKAQNCLTYITAVFESLNSFGASEVSKKEICFPSPISIGQLETAVRKYLNENNKSAIHGLDAVLWAWSIEFPCDNFWMAK